jgi:hypothetical protein
MATAYTTYSDGKTIANASGYNAAGAPAATVITGLFDASKRRLTSGDSAAVVTIPANTFVHKVAIEVLTADTSQNVDIGDGYGSDCWGEDLSLANLASVMDQDADSNTTGKFYSAADTIDVLCPGSKLLDTARFKIHAFVTLLG